MKYTRDNVRRLMRTWVQGRRSGYLTGGAVVLIAGGLALANFAPQPRSDPIIAAPPSDTSAKQQAPAPAAIAPSTSSTAPVSHALPHRTPVPASERVPKPEKVRGLYLNAWAAGSSRKLDRLIDVANRTEINSFIIDVKEGGEVSYRSSVPLAAEIGADREYIRDIQGVLARLKANGIYPIARIVVFRDKTLANAKPEWAIQKADGSLWHDNADNTWVDSFNEHVWDYNIAIAREAIELGFSEVQWDYVRFPDVPRSYMRTAVWPAQQGRLKEDAIREFLLYSRAQLADLGVPVTADVFGLTVSVRDDMGIGQLWEKMVDATDVLLPMVYPSHFARGSYGIAYPNGEPYNVIKTSLGYAVRRSAGVPSAATIRPWLQDFTLGSPRYGAAQVRAQIEAVYAAGLTEWVLWNPGSNYTVAALASRDGAAPSIATPDPRSESPSQRPAQADTPKPKTDPEVAKPEVKKPAKFWGMPVKADSGRKIKPDTSANRP